MKKSPPIISSIFLAGLSALLPAAQITWEASVDMYDGANSDHFVDTTGSPVIAVNPTGGTHGDLTLNGPAQLMPLASPEWILMRMTMATV